MNEDILTAENTEITRGPLRYTSSLRYSHNETRQSHSCLFLMLSFQERRGLCRRISRWSIRTISHI